MTSATTEIIQLTANIIVAVAGVTTALMVLVQNTRAFSHRPIDWLIRRINRPVLKQLQDFDDKNTVEHHLLTSEINDNSKTLHELKMDKLKSDICNEGIPLTERVNSADRYLKEGYNGEIKIMCKLLKNQLEEQIKSERAKKK